MKFTIEDLKNGKCAVKNDGSVEELREVLRRAFPRDSAIVSGGASYYMKMDGGSKDWDCSDSPDLPYQSLKDFITEKPSVEEMVCQMWEYYQEQKGKRVVEGGHIDTKVYCIDSDLSVERDIINYTGVLNHNVEAILGKGDHGRNSLSSYLEKCIDAYFNRDKHVDITKWYGDFDDN